MGYDFGPTIEIEDAEVVRMLKAGVREYEAGAKRAFVKAGARLKRHAAKRIAKEKGVAQKHVNIRFRLLGRRSKEPGITVSFYTLPLVPHKIGGRQTATGVKAGKNQWPGGFFAPVKKGSKKQIAFQRQGAARLPIERIHLPLNPEADQIIERAAERYGNALVNKDLPDEIMKILKRGL